MLQAPHCLRRQRAALLSAHTGRDPGWLSCTVTGAAQHRSPPSKNKYWRFSHILRFRNAFSRCIEHWIWPVLCASYGGVVAVHIFTSCNREKEFNPTTRGREREHLGCTCTIRMKMFFLYQLSQVEKLCLSEFSHHGCCVISRPVRPPHPSSSDGGRWNASGQTNALKQRDKPVNINCLPTCRVKP